MNPLAPPGTCLWCDEQFPQPLYCSAQCASSWNAAARPWPLGYCRLCGGVFNAKGRPQQMFCSRSCSQQAPPQPDDTPPDCCVCGAESQRRSWFCAEHTSTDKFLADWLAGADGGTPSGGLSKICRSWFMQRTSQCAGCGAAEWRNRWYSGPVPLELDHVDGNPRNNRLANFRALCPNCHATTDTYAGRKRGGGRQQQKRVEQLRTGQFDMEPSRK